MSFASNLWPLIQQLTQTFHIIFYPRTQKLYWSLSNNHIWTSFIIQLKSVAQLLIIEGRLRHKAYTTPYRQTSPHYSARYASQQYSSLSFESMKYVWALTSTSMTLRWSLSDEKIWRAWYLFALSKEICELTGLACWILATITKPWSTYNRL